MYSVYYALSITHGIVKLIEIQVPSRHAPCDPTGLTTLGHSWHPEGSPKTHSRHPWAPTRSSRGYPLDSPRAARGRAPRTPQVAPGPPPRLPHDFPRAPYRHPESTPVNALGREAEPHSRGWTPLFKHSSATLQLISATAHVCESLTNHQDFVNHLGFYCCGLIRKTHIGFESYWLL